MATQLSADTVALGFAIRHTLRGNTDFVTSVSWSPDGLMLVSGSEDGSICLWEASSGKLIRELEIGPGPVCNVIWSRDGKFLEAGLADCSIRLLDPETGAPRRIIFCKTSVLPPEESATDLVFNAVRSPDGRYFASGSWDNIVRLWEAGSGHPLRSLVGHDGRISCLAWSADGRFLASGGEDATIRIWDARGGKVPLVLEGHHGTILALAWTPEVEWSPEGPTLVSSSEDGTVKIWNPGSGQAVYRIEGNRSPVVALSYSRNYRYLALKGEAVKVWDCLRKETVAVLNEPAFTWRWRSGLAFHPSVNRLATFGTEGKAIRIWDLAIPDATDPALLNRYTNAKVVLLGDPGAGKTGLALALADPPYRPTGPGEVCRVRTLGSVEARARDDRMETRETLLWDLTGPPDARLLQQLHLNQVNVALLVFDARHHDQPLARVCHWDRELRRARAFTGSNTPMKKFIVAARIDRGGAGFDPDQVQELVRTLHLAGYIETSAREGWGIAELKHAIGDAIDWEALPKVSSVDLFQRIRNFLVEEGREGRILASMDELFSSFVRSPKAPHYGDGLRGEFTTSIGLLESIGLVRRLSFGGLVLLRPGLLDSYAQAMINAARDEENGLGCLSEEDARHGHFPIPERERLGDKVQEGLLLIATIEDLIRHEIGFRGHSNDGPRLVFPAQISRERGEAEGAKPAAKGPGPTAKILAFDGPSMNIYATLAVRLSYSGIFELNHIYKQYASYRSSVGGECGISLREHDETHGELVLSFDSATSADTRIHFEAFIQKHLERWSIPGSIRPIQVLACPDCGYEIPDVVLRHREGHGRRPLFCLECGKPIPRTDPEPAHPAPASAAISLDMERNVEVRRKQEAVAATFDVFLCHNTKDKEEVKLIGRRLIDRGIVPWLDEWDLRPGTSNQRAIEEMIGGGKSAAIFIGKSGLGPWSELEQQGFIREFVKRKCPVIPVILPGCVRKPKLPVLLAGLTWVDFRKLSPDPLNQLIYGITGQKPADPDPGKKPGP